MEVSRSGQPGHGSCFVPEARPDQLPRTRAKGRPSMSTMSSVEGLRAQLERRFGFKQFRAGQAEAVGAALEGRDVLVVMPTGSGKSLCYQLPSLEQKGTTV